MSRGLLRLIHRAGFLGGIAPPPSSRLSCRYAADQGDLRLTLERTVCDAGSGVSEWRDHAGGGGQGPGLGPGFPVRRLGLRGLPDVPGPLLVGSGAPGAAEAKSRGTGFRASRPGPDDGAGSRDDQGQRDQGRNTLCPGHPRRGTPVASVPASACSADRGDRRPSLRRWADRQAPREGRADDQPSRPAVEAVRHQVDEPAGERAGHRDRAAPGLSRRSSWMRRAS